MDIYLASPLGFTEAGRLFYEEHLLRELRAAGYDVYDPWVHGKEVIDGELRRAGKAGPSVAAWKRANRRIGGQNARAIREARAVVAVLDGSDVDSGTAAEVGFAAALGKPVIGYRNDLRMAGDNAGALVNLQVEYFVLSSGAPIVSSVADVVRALRRALARKRRATR